MEVIKPNCREKNIEKEPPEFRLKIEGLRKEHDTMDKMELEIVGDKAIAEEFNLFFSQIGIELSQKITYTGKRLVESYLRAPTDSKFSFTPVTDNEILEHIGTVTPKNSCGYDNLSSKKLIQIAPIIHPAIRLLTNQSLMTGIFTKNLEIAIVIPIYKGKNADPNNFGNYRQYHFFLP